MGWEEAGRGSGARSVEWGHLSEPYARPANELLFDPLDVASGVRLLDIACGSGFAAQLAARRGAAVAGLDAAETLVAIARARTPDVATAVRALTAAGPSVPAIGGVGYDAFCTAVAELMIPLLDPDLGIRITSEFAWITADVA